MEIERLTEKKAIHFYKLSSYNVIMLYLKKNLNNRVDIHKYGRTRGGFLVYKVYTVFLNDEGFKEVEHIMRSKTDYNTSKEDQRIVRIDVYNLPF